MKEVGLNRAKNQGHDKPTGTQWNNCLQNVRNLKNYQRSSNRQSRKILWRNLVLYVRFWTQELRFRPLTKTSKASRDDKAVKNYANIKDPSGWKFRERMFNTSNYRPKTLNRRNIAEIGAEKRKEVVSGKFRLLIYPLIHKQT